MACELHRKGNHTTGGRVPGIYRHTIYCKVGHGGKASGLGMATGADGDLCSGSLEELKVRSFAYPHRIGEG